MIGSDLIQAFSPDGSLSPGATAGLEAWWAGRMPTAPADGQVPVWSSTLGRYVPGAGGGGGGGGSATVTNNNDGTLTLTITGGASAVTDNGDGTSTLTI